MARFERYTVHIEDTNKQGLAQAKDAGYCAYNAGNVTAIEVETETAATARDIARQFGRIIPICALLKER